MSIIFFLEIILCTIFFIWYLRRLYKKNQNNIALKKRHSSYQKIDTPFYYSSNAIKQEQIIRNSNKPFPEDVLIEINASANLNYALSICNLPKYKNNQNIKIIKAKILSSKPEWKTKFINLMPQCKQPKHPDYLKALYFYLSAIYEIYITDMQAATNHLNQALKIYQKLDFIYEEAECYLLQAQIYRIIGLYDVAETILREADIRFRKMNLAVKKAEVQAYFGLIALGREQYTTAIQHLAGAAEIAKHNKLKNTAANIGNWLGLAFFLNQKYGKAEKHFTQVLKSTINADSKSFAAEMLARISVHKNAYKAALKYIDTALNVPLTPINKDTRLENLYLKAEILYKQQKDEQSAKILRHLIKQKLSPTSTFYQANAYTLMGQIELRKNNLTKAQTLFKQALDLELSKDRYKGAAIDYNNLAEIAHRQGLLADEKNYLKQALACAEISEDTTLKNILLSKLN